MTNEKQGLILTEATQGERKGRKEGRKSMPALLTVYQHSKWSFQLSFPHLLLLTVIEKIKVKKGPFCGFVCQRWAEECLTSATVRGYTNGNLLRRRQGSAVVFVFKLNQICEPAQIAVFIHEHQVMRI